MSSRKALQHAKSSPGPALPVRKKREYQLQDRDYSIQEIAEKLEDAIPFTVVVSKGYVNNTLVNTGLEENQAYRVQCVSRSTRILVSIDNRDGPPSYYSIPETYYINMARVDRSGKQIGPRQGVYQLLSDNRLPFRARFITDAFAKHHGRALFTSHIPPLNFIKAFAEIHILVNHIPSISKYDKIDDDILCVPQYYDKIRVRRVVGINNAPDYSKLEKEINTASGCLEFDMQYGAMEIDQFWPHEYNKKINYTNMEPMTSGIIADLFPKHTPKLPTPLYEQLSSKHAAKSNPHLYEHLSRRENSNTDADGGYMSINDVKLEAGMGNTPNYTNDIPRGEVKPSTRQGQGWQQPTHAQSRSHTLPAGVSSKPLADWSSEDKHKQLPRVISGDDIKKLTIDEVCGYLNELKIGQHALMFKEHLVDGVVLSDLDKNILTKEFGFTSFDAIKLMHFIREGHVPR